MIHYVLLKSNDTGVFECLVTRRAAGWEESDRDSRTGLAQLLALNTMWDQILKCIQDRVGAGWLFEQFT